MTKHILRYSTLLFVISIAIGISYILLALLFDTLQQRMINLSFLQKTSLSALVLSSVSTLLSWYLALRPIEKNLQKERVRTSEQIRLNAELRAALDAHALISITDAKGVITHVNDKLCEISGFSETELIGKNHRIVNSGHHDTVYIQHIWQTLSQGHSWHGEFCNKHKSGRLYWIDSTIAPLLNEEGKTKNYIAISRDITTSKTNETKLKQLKIALDACEEMVFFTDMRGNIQYANHALCQFTGWNEADLIGKKPSLFDSPNTSQDMLTAMRQKLTQDEPWSGRLLSRRKGIAPVRIEGQTTPPNPLEFWANFPYAIPLIGSL